MDATISLRTFGRRNNWFSERLQQFPTSSFKWVVLLLGIVVLAAFAAFMMSHHQARTPVQDSFEHVQAVSGLVRKSFTARIEVEHFLVANTPEAYASAEQALAQTQDAIEMVMRTAPPAELLTLSRLEQINVEYLNLFRSLDSLTQSGAADETQQTIRQQLELLGSALDQQAAEVLERSMASANDVLDSLSTIALRVGLPLLLALTVLFALSLALVISITRHSAYALHQIGQAARQITKEQYDTRIDLSGETNADIIHLGMAFNRMAENLQKALRAESAAQTQNQLQLMKLARQERKTAVLEERQRIARELHDSVKQQLFSITLSAGAAINLAQSNPDHLRTHLQHIQQAGHNAQLEMTALVQELVPVSMQDKRLEEALLTHLKPLCEIHGLKLLWRVDGTNTLTISQEHALFRAVQEAVSNVVRHSGATVLHISIKYGLVTHVIVEDNGVGFVPDAVPPTSTGLALMRTRLMRAGGRYELQTGPGIGTRLKILMDLRRMALSHP